jgi:MFS family permease
MPKGYPRYVLAVMVGISFLNYLDRWLPTGAGPVIQKDFHLDDFEVGALASAFLIVYAVCAIPFGIWADRWIRKSVVGIGVSIWSVATLLTGFAAGYGHLFATRAVVGVGEASYFPAGTSLLADYFPRTARGRAMSIWSVGQYAGIAVGFAGGGYLADTIGWRWAFFMTAVPGLILALLAFNLREPKRGSAEERGPVLETVHEADIRQFVRLLRIRTLVCVIAAQAVLFFVLAANATFMPFVLTRDFGFTATRAGIVAGIVLIVGGLVGTLAGGWLGDWRTRKTARGHLEVSAAGFITAAAASALALIVDSFPVFIAAFVVAVICISLYNGPFTAISQNVVIPSLRASAVTLSLFLAHLLGDSYAPAAAGFLSDLFQDLRLALLVVSPPLLVIAAIVTVIAFRTVARDHARMEADWAAHEAAA